jgi:predicted RNase H-like HicB family nuclease
MKYRAIIKKSDDWWIGWLVDLPGVNAQERTKTELVESLKIGAREMLETKVPIEADASIMLLNVPDPEWLTEVYE